MIPFRLVVGILTFALAALSTVTAAASTPDSLLGIWAGEVVAVPGRALELEVVRGESSWRADLGEEQAEFKASETGLRFVFPRNRGSFRGRLTSDQRSIEGFWVQNDVRVATPVRLASKDSGRWRGTVWPLEDRFRLYLKIFRDDGGALIGAFRNPELNWIGGPTQYRVSRDGQTVHFKGEVRGREVAYSALLSGSPDRLVIRWPNLDSPIELTRRPPSEAAAFFPRPPGDPPYTYRQPPATGDGWETARARDGGLDEGVLTRIVQRVIDSDPAEARPTLMHSILVAHRGKLVLEEYFFGYDRDTPHSTRSASKTFSSILLGAVMMEGSPLGPETRVYELLAGLGPFANPDPRKDRITLGHLMTHSTGLACDDNDDASPGNEDVMQEQTEQPNWWKYTLDLPLVRDPGSQYAYCSGGMNLMGAALTMGTGTWLPELFHRTIASPLEFGRYYWNLMPTGEGYLGGGVVLLPRDLLKVGQVFLDKGSWRGRRVFPSAWARRSTSPPPELYSGDAALNPAGKDGYAWHLSPITSGSRTWFAYNANGNGGQILLVVPELELTVVFTAGNYRQGNWLKWIPDIVGGEIIPAIRQ